MNVTSGYDPSSYSDPDLLGVFWSIDRDEYPERYEIITKELKRRNIDFEDLTQHQRNYENHEHSLKIWEFVKDKINSTYSIAIVLIAAITYVYNNISS
jgi:hypothetical protein